MRTSHDEDTAGWPDRAIAAIAGRQRTMITRQQLLALGVSSRAIMRALRRGRLHRVHQGVYSLVRPQARPPLAAEEAALLACGPSAVLSHHSAAILHGLRSPSRASAIHITTTESHHRRHPGIVVHRTTALHPREHHRVQSLPATSIARTLVDLAPLFSARQLAPLVDQALRKTSRTQILETLEHHPRRPGTPRLRELLDPRRPSEDTWSRAEAKLLAAIRRAHLPTPESNQPIGDYIADLLWREQRVIVEYDSEHYHSGPGVFHSDRSRHNDLSAGARHEVLHVTKEHINREIERVIVWITQALISTGGW